VKKLGIFPGKLISPATEKVVAYGWLPVPEIDTKLPMKKRPLKIRNLVNVSQDMIYDDMMINTEPMNKIFYTIILIVFGSCQNNKVKQADQTIDNLTEGEKSIAQTFSDIDSLLNIDNGKFWGK